MAETLTIPPAILATDARLGEPVPFLDGRVAAFGDLDLLGRLGLTDFNSGKTGFSETIETLVARSDAELIQRTLPGGLVARYGDYAVKYCWEAPAGHEAIISEAMRLGLANIEEETNHGITVPRVVAGISSQSRGVLITEFIAAHKPVLEFGYQSKRRFDNEWRKRMRYYRNALQTVGLEGPAVWLHEIDFDDAPRNTLWPANFFVIGDKVFPPTSVRLDFGQTADKLREHLPPIAIQAD